MKTFKYDWPSILPNLAALRYSGMSVADCCAALGIVEGSLRSWLATEGREMPPIGPDVPPPRKPRKPPQSANVWTAHQTKTLIEMWPYSSPTDIGATIGRTTTAVIAKAASLDLGKTVKTLVERRCLCGCGETFHSALPRSINRIKPEHASRIA